MEHIEEAGIHSGDSACALPPITLGRRDIDRIRESTEVIARGVGVRGLLNVQYALTAGVLYVLEANPRASRTVPFVSKATAVPVAKAAARVMLGATVRQLRAEGLLPATGDGGTLPLDAPIAVKEVVLPFGRFRDAQGRGVDTVLGPEMRSTGEVMGIDEVFGTAYAKSQAAAYGALPVKGRAFVSVADRDKRSMIFPVKRLADLGFEIWATRGTGEVLRRNGVRATIVRKHSDGVGPDGEPDIVARILDGQVDLIVNTPFGSPGQSGPRLDGYEIRTAAVRRQIPCVTTIQGLAAAVQGIEAITRGEVGVRSLQEHARALRGGEAAAGGAVAGARRRAARWLVARPGSARRRAVSHDERTLPAGREGRRAHPSPGQRDGAHRAQGRRVLRHDGGRAGDRGQVPAGPVRRDRGGRPGDLDAVAPRVLDPRGAARPRRHGRVRVRRRWPGHPLARRAAHERHDRHRRAARAAVPRSPRPDELPAGRRRIRQCPRCSRWRTGCAAAAARSTSCSAPPAPTGYSARSAPAAAGRTATITTEDGSIGVRGLVTDVLGQVIHECRNDVIYACGPMGMLRQVTAVAGRYGIPAQVLVEESMACGTGVCMTCVLPVVGRTG
jgi:carbamoyl-phosphate synthase large subunit